MRTPIPLRFAATSITVLLLAAEPQGTVSFGDRLTASIATQMTRRPSTGAAVGVVRNGKLIYLKGFGLRNIAARKPVDADTRFEIGSVSKQFTAAAILQLKERGKLGLDDRLAKFVPSFPHAGELTLRQLLNQVSGLADYTEVGGIDTDTSKPGGLAKIAAFAQRPLHFVPGTRWEYSSTNSYVLGRVIEVVSHRPYDDYVRGQLFAPARMSHSDFIGNESNLTDFATPYWQGRGSKGATRPAPPFLESWAGGAGAIVSTVRDLAAWDTALAGGKIVTPDDYKLMSTPFVLSNGTSTTYGMGLGVNEVEGHKRVWHSGGTNGSLTLNATYPNDAVAIIVLENNADGDPSEIEGTVFSAIFPRAAATASKPVGREDMTMRPHILHLIDEALHGAIPASEMSPQFQNIALPEVQKQVARRFARLGPPKAVAFMNKGPRTGAMRYTYRVEFTGQTATFIIVIDDKTKLLDAMGIRR